VLCCHALGLTSSEAGVKGARTLSEHALSPRRGPEQPGGVRANAFFTAGLVLCDIPTGVVADVWGRRISYLLG
jgi:hypothetical protein